MSSCRSAQASVRFSPFGLELGAEGTTWCTTSNGTTSARYTTAVITVTGHGVNPRGLDGESEGRAIESADSNKSVASGSTVTPSTGIQNPGAASNDIAGEVDALEERRAGKRNASRDRAM